MKSIKLLPDQGHSKTNGRDARKNDGGSKRSTLTTDQLRSKQKHGGGDRIAEEVASLRNHVDKTIHEIRNPLTAISLANQALHEQIAVEELPESVFACTAIIQKNVETIEKMLKELLAGHSSCADAMPTDVCFVLENSLCRASDRIYLKKLEVHKSYSPGLVVAGNAEKLSLAFLNIIVNAIEAVKEQEGKIWITAYRVKNRVKVLFKDNGAGMEPEVASKMFNKNFTGKSEGLGVGLSHVKEILDWHQASVSVNSEPGSGTTILIEFAM